MNALRNFAWKPNHCLLTEEPFTYTTKVGDVRLCVQRSKRRRESAPVAHITSGHILFLGEIVSGRGRAAVAGAFFPRYS
jgi:hypothetical protein